ncbi:MAG: hypothetical protein NVSMB44_25430 [Ktedonobacteraceae bacterium]
MPYFCHDRHECKLLEVVIPMLEKNYAHRDVLDKLGIKPGYAVALRNTGYTLHLCEL